MGIKMYKRCIPSTVDLLLNVIFGIGIAAIIVLLIVPSQYLFFNQISSNKEICTMPSKQTFKCNVYKNGELIGSV
jgi:uncharacterized membrane protein YukC